MTGRRGSKRPPPGIAPGGALSRNVETQLEELAMRMLALGGTSGATKALGRARQRWTPARASTALIFFFVAFCVRRRIHPISKARLPVLSRDEVHRAIAKIDIPLGNGTKRFTIANLRKQYQRGALLAKSPQGFEQLVEAMVAVRPGLALPPLLTAKQAVALMAGRLRVTATLS